MPDTADLSDKAVAVLAFAAYHQLTSGQPVKSVVREDGKGHKADEEAVAELERRGLATVEGNDIAFTQDGLTVLARAVDGLRRAAKGA
jgi:chromosome segregation and condensation protein ScpB